MIAVPVAERRELRWYLGGVAAWFTSFGIQNIVFPWLVAVVRKEPAQRVGIAQMAMMAPAIVFMLLGGAVADRADCRRFLLRYHLLDALALSALAGIIASASPAARPSARSGWATSWRSRDHGSRPSTPPPAWSWCSASSSRAPGFGAILPRLSPEHRGRQGQYWLLSIIDRRHARSSRHRIFGTCEALNARRRVGSLGMFRVRGRLTGPTGRSEDAELLVDTGATLLVVPRSLADLWEAVARRSQPVLIAEGQRVAWPVAEVGLSLNGPDVTTPCFIAADGPALLGAVALESLLLTVDPVAKRLVPVEGFVG